MTKNVFFSRTWLMAGTILFLSAACQPKAPVSDEQQMPKAKSYATPSKEAGCKEESCKPCGECPKKECPCPAECPKKECKKECPCPAECPKKECKKECPCPEPCKKECPCPAPAPKKECTDNAEVKSDVEKSVTQSPVLSESSTETTSSSAPATTEAVVAS